MVAFSYLNETIGGKMRSLSNSSCFILYGFGGVILNIFAIWINSYWEFYIIMLFGNFIFSLGFFRMTKTPFYCLEKKNYQEFRRSVLYIAKTNNLESESLEDDIDNFIQNKSNDDFLSKKRQKTRSKRIKNFLKEFFTIKIIKRLFISSVFMGYSYMVYGISTLMNDTLGFDSIFLNGIMLCAVETLGYLLMFTFGYKLRRKLVHSFCYWGIALLGLFLLILGIIQIHRSHGTPREKSFFFKILETLFGLFIKLLVCSHFAMLFNYVAELFPTKSRSFAFGLSLTVGLVFNSLGTYFLLFSQLTGLNAFVGVLFGVVISLPVALFSPETKDLQIEL